MTARTRDLGGTEIPTMLYGTAWKEDTTAACTEQALRAGFRGIDTANQRKHYFEEGVGVGMRRALDAGVCTRDDLFLQTKFTFAAGQDHRLPYDPRAPVAAQVRQSFERSLVHLGVDRLDALLLHGPSVRTGLADADWEAWGALGELAASGRVAHVGVSNVSAAQLRALCTGPRPPALVQNRCYASRGWDAEVRAVCAEHGIVYEGFSLLTANRDVWNGAAARAIARRRGCTPALVLFRYALHLGMVALTGTTDPRHMAADLEVYDLELDDAELAALCAPQGPR